DVFLSLYPSLPELVPQLNGRIPIDLYVYGPGLEQGLNLQRKIIKAGSYKNWRLDGEFIYDPTPNPERFHPLTPGDLVLLEFGGDAVVPTTTRMFLLCNSSAPDTNLHRLFSDHLGARPMAVLAYASIERI